ncbi:MAG: universal stress protein [Woeseiaceae bacterium]|nr:universal stress protein [Woeseiaceae bacterium]
MKPVRKILCIVDPARDNPQAPARAAMLAQRFDAELALFVSRHYSYLNEIAADFGQDQKEFGKAVIESLREQLEAIAEPLRSQGLAVTTNADWRPDPCTAIIGEAERVAADLVVKDTRYHSAIARALFSSTDWNLIRRCTLPLWLVKPGVSFEPKCKLLACVDPVHEHDLPESLDDDILETGKQLAAELEGALHAIHWFNPMMPRGNDAAAGDKPQGAMSDRLWETHAQAFTTLVERHDIPPARRHLQTGAAQTLLPALVEDLGVSLTILGAVTAARTRHRLIGSTAESVLDRVASDVLILKPA